MIMRIILNKEAYIMIMRIILNKDRIDASSTNHPSRCELILIRYIMSIHPHRESISLPWPPLKMRIILIFSFFRGGGGTGSRQRGELPLATTSIFQSGLTMLVPYSIITVTPISTRRKGGVANEKN